MSRRPPTPSASPASRRRFASPTHSNSTARAAGVLKSSASASKKRCAYAASASGAGRPGRAAAPARARGRPPAPPPPALARVSDRLAIMAAREVHDQRVAPVLVERGVEERDVADRLGHLLALDPHHPVVHPDPRQRLAAGGLGLGDLVLVMGEDEVRAAAVDLEVGAEDRLRHRRALDVPARPALAPRRRPGGVLALLARLPEREVLRARFSSAASSPSPCSISSSGRFESLP